MSDYDDVLSNKSAQIMPFDDVKKSIVSLAHNEEVMRGVINLNFKNGRLENMCFGDILLYAMSEYSKDFTKSIEKTKDILKISGKVLPVTFEKMKICAELEDGTIIEGKANIRNAVNSKISKISRVYLNPYSCRPAIRCN